MILTHELSYVHQVHMSPHVGLMVYKINSGMTHYSISPAKMSLPRRKWSLFEMLFSSGDTLYWLAADARTDRQR